MSEYDPHLYDLFKLKEKKSNEHKEQRRERKKRKLIADVVVSSAQIHAAQINKKGDRRSQDEDRMSKEEKEKNKRAHNE